MNVAIFGIFVRKNEKRDARKIHKMYFYLH